jgi:hypothetical protein
MGIENAGKRRKRQKATFLGVALQFTNQVIFSSLTEFAR